MYDESQNDIGVFDFYEFASHLLDQGVELSPSQLHGCLSGLLAAGAEAEPEYGLDALSQSLEVHVHGELASRIMQLYHITFEALAGDEFLFYPLLPEDEEDEDDLELRTQSLASWCKGFLTGFAYRIAAQKTAATAFSQETGEVLRDIAAMAEAVADEGSSEEEAEDSYIELVEYLRIAVMNVFVDSHGINQEALMAETERPLH